MPSHLYIHKSAEDELTSLLRVLIFAAKQVVGDIPYEVVKIALDGKTISFLHYPHFDDDPHPALFGSIKVYLPRASFSIRSYRNASNPPILHRKETLVLRSYAFHDKFRQLTEQEEKHGLLSSSEIGYRQSWQTLLYSRAFSFHDQQLVLAPQETG